MQHGLENELTCSRREAARDRQRDERARVVEDPQAFGGRLLGKARGDEPAGKVAAVS